MSIQHAIRVIRVTVSFLPFLQDAEGLNTGADIVGGEELVKEVGVCL